VITVVVEVAYINLQVRGWDPLQNVLFWDLYLTLTTIVRQVKWVDSKVAS